MMPKYGDIWRFSDYIEDTFLIVSDGIDTQGDIKVFDCFCLYYGRTELIGFHPSMDRWSRLG